ncbi:centrosomal protein of 295 kDa [Rhinophrynus dorsalis]
MYPEKMKRKVAKVGTLRLSPNEEALLLKQEREKRRKLRLQQVREQEKSIAQQIRQDVKERRDQQLQQLAEDLRAEWQATQAEKLRALEKLYLSSLNAIGEGHRQAKENEPDLEAIEKRVAANKEKAERRHREALKELKQHKEKQLKEQTWLVKARKKALEIEKQRAAKIASLPPPPPDPLENLEVLKRLPTVKLCNVDGFSESRYHLPEPYVDREMHLEQPDARAAAAEEAKRLDALQKEEERERREQIEKANLRGTHALKMVHLTQDRDKLLKELEQMQQDDLARRRQVVAQMPQQLFEPAYRRAENRQDWQRELESAFEDLYTRDRQVRGDMVLNLKPQPLPVPSVRSVDEDLDVSMEPECVCEIPHQSVSLEEERSMDELQEESKVPQSRLVLKRLLSKIRTQKDHWSSRSDVETVSDTVESGSLPSEKGTIDVKHRAEQDEGSKQDTAEAEDVTDHTVLAGNSIILRPLEQAAQVRQTADKHKELEDIERQKQEQLDLLKKLEEQRKHLEAEFLKVQLEMQEAKKQEMAQQTAGASLDEKPPPVITPLVETKPITKPLVETGPVEAAAPVSGVSSSTDSPHIQMIREYQQRLIQQNRQHKQSVDEARKRLQEYQLLLKKRYSHLSTSRVVPTAENQLSVATNQSLDAHTFEKSGEANASASVLNTRPPYSRIGNVSGPATGPQNTLSSTAPLTAPLTRKAEYEHPGEKNLLTSQGQAVLIHSPSRDTLAEQQVAQVDMFTEEQRSPVNVDHVANDMSEGVDSQAKTSSIEKVSPSPEKNTDGPNLTVTCPEIQSSLSSQGEDTGSESFYALPPSLSLGLPQVGAVLLPEPSGPAPVPEQHVEKNIERPFGEFSSVQEFRNRLLYSTAEIQAQQDHLRQMQLQLDKQREYLLSKQKSQEEQLLEKQKELEEQMRKHQESLEHFLTPREVGLGPLPPDICQIPRNERSQLVSALLKALEENQQEDIGLGNGLGLRTAGREQRVRSSKPPVTKTKLGPMVNHHELSAIMEVETPKSGRCSSTGVAEHRKSTPASKDGPGSEEQSAPTAYNPESSSVSGSSDSSQRELDLSRISTSSHDTTTSRRSRTKLSWRETLALEAAASNKLSNAGQSWLQLIIFLYSDTSQSPSSQSGLPSYPAATGTGFSVHPSAQEIANWLGATARLRPELQYTPPVQALEAFYDFLSTTTISTGSFLTSEKAESSPESLSELQKCNYSIIKDTADSGSDSLVSLLPLQTKLDEPVIPESAPGAMESRSHIQQIIDRYTKDLSASLERNLSFHTPDVAIDISTVNDNHFPATFHPLDPKPDFTVSTHSYAHLSNSGNSRDAEDLRQISIYENSQDGFSLKSPSFHSQENNHSPQNGDLATRFPIQQTQTLDSSASFHPLSIECTLNEPSLNGQDNDTPKQSVHELDNRSTRTLTQTGSPLYHVNSLNLDADFRLPTLQSSVEILRNESQSQPENLGSFNELIATQVTVNDSALSEHLITDLLKPNNADSCHFEELPVIHIEHNQADATETNCDIPHRQDTDGSPVLQNSHSSTVSGAILDSSNQTLKSEILSDASRVESSANPPSLSAFTIGSSASSLPSSIPLWGTESSRGILEEPELTLVSFNDSSVAGSEHITTLTSISDHPMETSTSQSSFHPLPAEPDSSVFTVPDWSSAGCSFTDRSSSSQHFAAMDLKFTSTPGNLQEAFLKKKKHFIEKSSKRLVEMKQKDRVTKKTEFKSPPNVTSDTQVEQCNFPGDSSTDRRQLKKVVEVRVCTPEVRKLSEIEMHQRTIRLYNQLDEVKTKKEEKMRQESYARNRDKAKEFKKKTLEKLRSRNQK